MGRKPTQIRRRSTLAATSSQLARWAGGAAVAFGAGALVLRLRTGEQQDLCTTPRVWLQHDFLSSAEVEQILAESETAGRECWEHVSSTQRTAMLETCPRLASTALMVAIDQRVAAALGVDVPRLEHGYLQEYTANYSAHNLHLDQGEAMVPARVGSAIIYLDDQPVGSGHTVLPLAAGCRDAYEAAHVAALGRYAPGAARALRSRGRVEAGWAVYDPKLRAGRISSRFFKPGGYGAELFAVGLEHCRAGLGVRPRRGTALFFEARWARPISPRPRLDLASTSPRPRPDLAPTSPRPRLDLAQARVGGAETIAATHGSCDVAADAPTKRVLVKLACDGVVR